MSFSQALSSCRWHHLHFHIQVVQRRRHVLKSDAYCKVEEYHCSNGLGGEVSWISQLGSGQVWLHLHLSLGLQTSFNKHIQQQIVSRFVLHLLEIESIYSMHSTTKNFRHSVEPHQRFHTTCRMPVTHYSSFTRDTGAMYLFPPPNT